MSKIKSEPVLLNVCLIIWVHFYIYVFGFNSLIFFEQSLQINLSL